MPSCFICHSVHVVWTEVPAGPSCSGVHYVFPFCEMWSAGKLTSGTLWEIDALWIPPNTQHAESVVCPTGETESMGFSCGRQVSVSYILNYVDNWGDRKGRFSYSTLLSFVKWCWGYVWWADSLTYSDFLASVIAQLFISPLSILPLFNYSIP